MEASFFTLYGNFHLLLSLKKKSPTPGTLHLIIFLSVYNNPLSLLKIKIEVKVIGDKAVNNIHLIGIVAYKSKVFFKKTSKMTKKQSISRKSPVLYNKFKIPHSSAGWRIHSER
jgi:hypothetical protein